MKYQKNNKPNNTQTALKIVVVLLLGLTISRTFAAFEIKKHTINSGGSEMNSATYKLNGSFGQVDASNTKSVGSFSLNGGFWNKIQATPINETIFTNGFE